MRTRFTILVLFLICLSLVSEGAPSKGIVRGIVKNSENGAIDFSTVMFVSVADSTVMLGAITDEKGAFSLSVPEGRYKFEVSYLGYDNHQSEVSVTAATETDLGVVVLKPGDLVVEDVVVKGKAITRRADGYVMNLSGSKIAEGRTTLEALRYAPGVLIDKDNGVTINGRSGTQVMINDRIISMSTEELSNYLSTINAEDVKSIEIVNVAGSSSDASVTGGILKIVLKKQALEGVQGTVSMSLAGNDTLFMKANPSVSVNYMKGKFRTYLSAGYNYGSGSPWQTQRGTEVTNYDNGTFLFADIASSNVSKNINGRAGIMYDIDAKQTVGADFDVYTNRSTAKFLSTSLQTGVIPPIRMQSNYELMSAGNNFNLSLNYKILLDTLGSQLLLVGDYHRTSSNSNGNQWMNNYTEGTTPIPVYQVDSMVRMNDYFTARADYTKYFGSKTKLEAGAKYSYANMDNDISYYDKVGGDWVYNPSISDSNTYTEGIAALYAIFSASLGDLDLSAGLRIENTDVRPTSYTNPDAVEKQNYTDFFPSAAVSYAINKESGYLLNLNYRRTINRPSFSALNPFRVPLNSYSYVVGNPKLKPSYSNSIDFTATLANKYAITAGWFERKGAINQYILEDPENPGIVLYKNLNGDNISNFSLSASVPIDVTKWWRMSLSVNGIYGTTRHEDYSKELFYAYCQANNYFTLPKDWGIELNGNYMSGALSANYTIGSLWELSSSLKKGFFDNKFIVLLNFSDMFLSDFNNLSVESKTFTKEITMYNATRCLTLTLRYNFKAGKDFKVKNVIKGNSEDSSRY